MFVVTVEFKIKTDKTDEFMSAMLDNANKSLTLEEGCVYFDVCQNPNTLNSVFLYELYKEEADFKIHLQSSHFLHFDKSVSEWITSKSVKTWIKR